MHKKAFIVLVLLGLLLANPLPVGAQTNAAFAPAVVHPLQIAGNQATVTFADLGQSDMELISPYDSTRVLFSVPSNWTLASGGAVELTFDLVLSGGAAGQITGLRNPYGGALVVSFNNQIIGNIPLTDLGTRTVRLEIPDAALAPVREDGRHQLSITLDAKFSCVYDIRAVVSIKNTSLFDLRFNASAPKPDLTKLPAPFFLRNSLVPDSSLVVTPDNPSEFELQSALNVVAGFGAMIGQDYSLEVIPVGQLTQEDMQQNNLIFVGKPAGFGLLSSVQFPLPVANGQFSSLPAESAQDGILEMGPSPWNANKVVMLVSGASDAAVVKAAQALSSGQVLAFKDPALAYVSDVQLLAPSIPVVQDFTLESLGYSNETLGSIGLNYAEFKFNVSKEQVPAKDASLSLLYYHSSLADNTTSSLRVNLNNQIIGSAAFTKESEQLTTLNITIPPGILRFGENSLEIVGRLQAQISCDTSGFSNPWLVISNQSGLHLPADTTQPLTLQQSPDLKLYPNLFLTQSDLGDLALILPKASPLSWKLAGQMVYEMGSTMTPPFSNLRVAYADNVGSDIRDGYSMILVGRPSDLAFLSEVNNNLPAPFDLASNTATERDSQIVYRIPAGVSVGYLEVLHSPYNPEKMMLIAAGNDDTGLGLAGAALTQPALRSRLAGQFAVTNGIQVATSSLSSQFSIVSTVVPSAEKVVITPLAPGQALPSGFGRPSWLAVLPIVSGVLILLIILYVVVLGVARRRGSLPEELLASRPVDSEPRGKPPKDEKK